MKATIKINMDNAAFEDSGELGRILREVADKLDRCELRYTNAKWVVTSGRWFPTKPALGEYRSDGIGKIWHRSNY